MLAVEGAGGPGLEAGVAEGAAEDEGAVEGGAEGGGHGDPSLRVEAICDLAPKLGHRPRLADPHTGDWAAAPGR